MSYQIQIRRDIAANWTNANPTLAEGEFGFETDTKRIKIGDGNTPWNTLPYYKEPITFTDTLSAALWNSSNQQDITVTGLTTEGVIIVCPYNEVTDIKNYADAGIYAVSVASDTVTFECMEKPNEDIDVIITVLKF